MIARRGQRTLSRALRGERRKAQFEIMGLAIIVVIISVAIFLLLAFSFDEGDDLANQFFEEQFAQNTLDALMKTSLEGCKGTVADYVTSQVTEQPLRPLVLPPPGDDLPSCATDSGLEELKEVLDETFAEYIGRTYRFQVRKSTCNIYGHGCDFLIDYPQNTCDPKDPVDDPLGKPGRQLLSKYPDPKPAEVVLWICAS